MNLHRFTEGRARRQAVTGLVLVATFLLCLWIGNYKEWVLTNGHTFDVPMGFRVTPDWAIPVAVAVGACGAILAFLIYRPRRNTA